HVGTEPCLGIARRAMLAFRPACRRVGMVAGKVRLAQKGGVIAAGGQASGKSGLARRDVQVDTVVAHPVRQREQAGQYRRPGRLAHQAWRDAGSESGAVMGQVVEVRRPYSPSFESEAVTAVLIRSDEEDIGSFL